MESLLIDKKICKQNEEGGRYGLLAFFLAFLIMLSAYAYFGAYPFRDRHTLLIDEFHQYAPFLAELRRKLLGEGSLLFSWNGGLGYNFLANLAYYGASPFNLLMILFPPEFLTEAVLSLTLLKVAFSAWTMQRFLSRSYKGNSLLSAALAVAYSLSGFVMAYSWNIMWLDTLVFLPLAALGLTYLVREKRVAPYIGALALLLITNFYTGGFACLFLALYFFLAHARFSEEKGVAALLLSWLRFLASSLVAALCAAVLLLPSYYNLQVTSAAVDAFPAQFSLFRALAAYFSRMFLFAKPEVMSGLPNIYAGLIVLILLPVYAACKEIRLRARVLALALVAFFFLSFNFNVLNFIWHGLHYPNSLDYRYAFLFVFLVVGLCFDALSQLGKIPDALPALSAFFAAFLLLLLEMQISEEVTGIMVLGSLLFLSALLYAILRYFRSPAQERTRPKLAILLFALIVLECMANTFYSFYTNQKTMPYGPREGYAAGEVTDEIREAAFRLKEKNKGEFYRVVLEPSYTTNDGALYHYPSLNIFCSTYPHAPIKLMKQLGFETNGVNSVAHIAPPPVMDSLLGIRYLIRKNNAPGPADRQRKQIMEGSQIRIWENQEALSMGFFVAKDLTQEDYSKLDPLEAQSAFAQALGCSDQLYKFVEEPFRIGAAAEAGSDSAKIAPLPGDVLTISKNMEQLHVIVPETGYYALGWNSPEVKFTAVKAKVDEHEFSLGRLERGMGDLGYLESGTRLQLSFEQSKEQKGTVKLRLAVLNDELYRENMAMLKDASMKMDFQGGGHFSGTIQAARPGYLFFSLPYDEGWTFWVDGKKVKAEKAFAALTSLPLEEGNHEIKARFWPKGLRIGLSLSFLGLLILLLCFLRERHKQGKGKPVSSEPDFVCEESLPAGGKNETPSLPDDWLS